MGGLFAEGRVVNESATGLVVPTNAVNTTGPTPWALRVVDGKTERVDVTLGLRDPRTERVQVTSGLARAISCFAAPRRASAGTPVQVGGSE